MKRMLLLLAGAMIASFAQSNAQKWVTQHEPGLLQPDPEVAFSAVDANVCWGIKATISFNSRQSPQVVRTTNGGNSWDSVTVPGRAIGLEGSSIAAIDANTAWAVMWDRSNATGGGVFKTTNAGAGWTRDTALFPVSGARPEGMHFFDSNNGVAFGDPRGGFWEIYTSSSRPETTPSSRENCGREKICGIRGMRYEETTNGNDGDSDSLAERVL